MNRHGQKITYAYESLIDGHYVKEEDIMYDPNKYTEKKVEARDKVEEGTIKDDEVIEVVEGTMAKFIKNWEAYVAKASGDVDPNAPAIQVKTMLGARYTITLPTSSEYHPKSKFGQWVKNYKKPPFVGQKVKSVANEDGYFNVLIRQ